MTKEEEEICSPVAAVGELGLVEVARFDEGRQEGKKFLAQVSRTDDFRVENSARRAAAFLYIRNRSSLVL
jgi:hypothetical protein